MSKIKEKILTRLLILVYILVLWNGVTTAIQALKCPKMTYTELFLNIPNQYVLDFKECK